MQKQEVKIAGKIFSETIPHHGGIETRFNWKQLMLSLLENLDIEVVFIQKLYNTDGFGLRNKSNKNTRKCLTYC
jgi:hypothetical protein